MMGTSRCNPRVYDGGSVFSSNQHGVWKRSSTTANSSKVCWCWFSSPHLYLGFQSLVPESAQEKWSLQGIAIATLSFQPASLSSGSQARSSSKRSRSPHLYLRRDTGFVTAGEICTCMRDMKIWETTRLYLHAWGTWRSEEQLSCNIIDWGHHSK